MDITKETEVLSQDTNNREEPDVYLNKVNKIIEDKINRNDFIDIMNPKPIYINTTKYKKIND